MNPYLFKVNLLSLIFLIGTDAVAQTCSTLGGTQVTLTFENFDNGMPSGCNDVWSEQGYEMFYQDYLGNCYTSFYNTGLHLVAGEDFFFLDLGNATVLQLELDLVDGCGYTNTWIADKNDPLATPISPPGIVSFSGSFGNLSTETFEVPAGTLTGNEYFVMHTCDGVQIEEIRLCISNDLCGTLFELYSIPTSCGADNGWAYIVTEDESIADVQWSDGQSLGNEVRRLAPGNYTVTVTNFLGCTTVRSFTVANGSTGTVLEQKIIDPEVTAGDYFGEEVAIYENRAIVGACKDSEKGLESGAAYIYEYDGTNWQKMQQLLPDELGAGDEFGGAVSIHGNTAFVGARYDDDSGSNSGAVYVYNYDGVSWIMTQKLFPDDASGQMNFGDAIHLDGVRAIVGASRDDDLFMNSGAAYIFSYENGSWSQEQKLKATDAADADRFGRAVALSGRNAIVGANDGDGNVADSGSAYIFRLDGNNWIQQQELFAADGSFDDRFGQSVDIACDRAVVGAFYDDDNGSNSGSAYTYFYNYNNSSWELEEKIVPPDGEAGDNFGFSTAISNNKLVVGAYSNNTNATNSGAGYVYHHNGSGWSQVHKLTASNPVANNRLGRGAALYGDHILLGEDQNSEAGTYAGAVRFYRLPNASGDLDADGICDDNDFCNYSSAGGGDCYENCECFPVCNNVVYIVEDLTNFSDNQSALENMIISNTIQTGMSGIYTSEGEITILPGFSCEPGASFTAEIAPCPMVCFRAAECKGSKKHGKEQR